MSFESDGMERTTHLRNSPSVIVLIPASRCICTISAIALSSTTVSSSCVHFLSSKSFRFSSRYCGRLSEPRCSARKGGFTFDDISRLGYYREGGGGWQRWIVEE